LGLYTKPIIILNINNFYDPLVALLNRCIEEKFMSEIHRNIWQIIEDPAKIIEAITNAPAWSDDAIGYAKV
jgi:predicted Rossmann-fold nucleotide-binding protein